MSSLAEPWVLSVAVMHWDMHVARHSVISLVHAAHTALTARQNMHRCQNTGLLLTLRSGALVPAQAPSRQQVKWLRTTRTPIRRITFLPSCMPCKSTLSTAPAQLANRSAGAQPHEQHLAVQFLWRRDVRVISYSV